MIKIHELQVGLEALGVYDLIQEAQNSAGSGSVLVSSSPVLTTQAVDITITDAGDYFTSGNVESALQQIGLSIQSQEVALNTHVDDTGNPHEVTADQLGLVAGGVGDIWVEKAGDTMTGNLSIVKSQGAETSITISNVSTSLNARTGVRLTNDAGSILALTLYPTTHSSFPGRLLLKNNFGGTAVLRLEGSDSTSGMRINSSGNTLFDGNVTITPASDSTTTLNVTKSNGNALLTVDTVSGRVGVNTSSPTTTLTVVGATDWTNVALTKNIRFNPSASVGPFITTTTADPLVFGADGSAILTLGTTGTVTVKPTSNNTSTFLVEKSDGTGVFWIDTTNGRALLGVDGTTYNMGINETTIDGKTALHINSPWTGSSTGQPVLRVESTADQPIFALLASSTGNNQQIFRLEAQNSTKKAFQTIVTGEGNGMFNMLVSGIMEWGAGGGSGRDTNLYRSGANALKTDDSFDANSYLVAGGAGATGSFTTLDSKTVTVTSGLVTSIV